LPEEERNKRRVWTWAVSSITQGQNLVERLELELEIVYLANGMVGCDASCPIEVNKVKWGPGEEGRAILDLSPYVETDRHDDAPYKKAPAKDIQFFQTGTRTNNVLRPQEWTPFPIAHGVPLSLFSFDTNRFTSKYLGRM
jgi:hypothetical protein